MTPSPRSSVDTNRSPTSPFLQNISSRFRKGSVASHTSSQGSEAAPPTAEVPEKAESAQATKRYLLSIIRNDWEYPYTNTTDSSNLAPREPYSYRCREESASDIDTDLRAAAGSNSNDPYKFDNPDDIATSVQERRRKRRRLIDEELEWNDGLRFWTVQRDAWTGAVPHKPEVTVESKHDIMQRHIERIVSHTHTRDGSASTGTTQDTDYSRPDQAAHPPDEISASSSSMEADQFTSSNTELTQTDQPDGPYLPIYPPLLPMSHTLRSRIKPATYGTIYDKVVIQSLTPNVPIPLTHMIGALVAGWKAEGQWPPQPLQQRMLAVTKGGKKGDSAFAKWRREQDERKKMGLDNGSPDPGHPSRGMRKSISSAVKKVLGMDPERAEAEEDLQDIGLTFEEHRASMELESPQGVAENKFLNKELLG